MLYQLNERIKGIIAWVVVVLLALTFLMVGADYFLQSKQTSSTVATVNGEAISRSLFEQVYRRFRHQNNTMPSAPEDEGIKKKILEDLIMHTVTIQAAKETGFEVTQSQVSQTIAHFPQFQENGKFSPTRFSQVLAASMYTPTLLQAEIAQGLIINQQHYAFFGSAFVLPAEEKKYAEFIYETRDYAYATIPFKQYTGQVHVSDQELKAYYESHLNQFTTPARISLDYVMLSMDKLKKEVVLSDAEINQYYQENLASFKTAGKQAKEMIRAQLINEKVQALYAKALESLGEISYQNPDSLEPVSTAMHLPILHTDPISEQGAVEVMTKHPELLRIAFSKEVKELGNNSEPIQINPSTVVVIRVQKQFPPAPEPYLAVKEKIRSVLTTVRGKEQMAGLLKRLAEKRENLPKGISWKSVTHESREGETKNPLIRDTAFTLSKPREISGLYLSNGDFVLVQLNARLPGVFEKLDKDQKRNLQLQLESAYGTIDYDLYLRELLDKAQVTR